MYNINWFLYTPPWTPCINIQHVTTMVDNNLIRLIDSVYVLWKSKYNNHKYCNYEFMEELMLVTWNRGSMWVRYGDLIRTNQFVQTLLTTHGRSWQFSAVSGHISTCNYHQWNTFNILVTWCLYRIVKILTFCNPNI